MIKSSIINIVSLNINGLLNLVKWNRVASFLRQQKAGIAYLQETHLKSSETKLLRYLYRGDIYHASLDSRSAGIIGIGSTVD